MPNSVFSPCCPCFVLPQRPEEWGWACWGLAPSSSCVCARVCARVSFRAPGLTLRVWRVAMTVRLTSSGPGAGQSRTCSRPAPCQPPSPTASLALRASPCSGTCALTLPPRTPPPPSPVQVLGTGECSCPSSTLASRLSSLALCLLACLSSSLCLPDSAQQSVLGKYTVLSCATPPGVPALPSSSPHSGAIPS